MSHRTIILGAGVTGLAAGYSSNIPIYEASNAPGGICSSYYMKPGENDRLSVPPKSDEAYRFELGGGHWIWGGDSTVLRFMKTLTPFNTYIRTAAVYLPGKNLLVPYTIQNNLRYLGPELAAKSLVEMVGASKTNNNITTMAENLEASFGPTLCDLFFKPFHELYTAGLYQSIAPQDANKSPVNLNLAIQGAFNDVATMGYNTTFIYPKYGLDALVQSMAANCKINYERRATEIDYEKKIIYFENGSKTKYTYLLSTIPLNQIMNITSLDIGKKPDPATSVLVINIGAKKGPCCPKEHWVYIPKSNAGFHRVGFYSNVDPSFLPVHARKAKDKISIYVEKSYLEGQKPSDQEISNICQIVIKELQEWNWIEEVEVVNPTWVDVGYTWSWPQSQWKDVAIKTLESHGIHQIGRFANWALLSGITDSIMYGLMAKAVFTNTGLI